MSLILRPLRTGIFGFGRVHSRNLVNREDFTIPEAIALDADVLASVRSHIAAGYMQLVKSDPAHGLSSVRPLTARRSLLVQIGVGGVIPNGATLNVVTLGGVPFTFGNSNIDGATTAALLAAFLEELADSDDFAATGAVVKTSSQLATPAAVAATAAFTIGTIPTDGQILTIAGRVYRFKDTIAQVNDVFIGASVTTARANLVAAVMGTGVSGTNWYAGTTVHTLVTAAVLSTVVTFTAITAGSLANAQTSTTNITAATVSGATMSGGADTHAVVIIDGDDVADWAAFENASSVLDDAGEVLGAPLVTLTFPTNAAVAAKCKLTSDNTNVTANDTVTIDGKVYTFVAVPAVEGDVDIGVNADGSLLNLIRAINHTGTPDANYKCAAIHPTVSAAASVTSHTFVITARTAGSAGNVIDTTEAADTLSWEANTLTGGTDALDTLATDVPVYVAHVVTAGDVTRGYIELDTGLTNLSTKFAVRITRSGTAVLHDGTVNVKDSTIILIQNNGSVDFVAGDIVQAFAAGAD